MYPPATGMTLSSDQCQMLDDTFLSSDPFSYFKSRIEMLLQWAQLAEGTSEESTMAPNNSYSDKQAPMEQFARLLGRPLDSLLGVSPRSATMQLASDAFALRQQAAESLVRLALARRLHTDNGKACLWEKLSTSPNQLNQLIDGLYAAFRDDGDPLPFARLVLIDNDIANGVPEDLASVSDLFSEWVQFAINLLREETLQLNAAHNKMKHGLSARARDDLRVSFVSTPPNPDDTIPVQAFSGPDVIDIFDRPVIEVLAQGPKIDGHKQGLELTQLRVDIPSVLAETYMIAWTHGALFHVAAREHFKGRSDLPEYLKAPPHPGYPLDGPTPAQISRHAPLGMRFPLTKPPGGGEAARTSGIAFPQGFIPLNFGTKPPLTVTVVDDDTQATEDPPTGDIEFEA